MEVTSEEVRDSYKDGIIEELQSDTTEQMEENLEKIITRISSFQYLGVLGFWGFGVLGF